MARRWLAAAVLAAIIVRTHAGTDGAMDVFFEQQLESVNLDQLKDGKPIGVDIAGKLMPEVLKVGHLVDRGERASSQSVCIGRSIVGLSTC